MYVLVLYDHCGVQAHVLWSEADVDVLLNHSTLFFETKSLTESGSELAANMPTNPPAPSPKVLRLQLYI